MAKNKTQIPDSLAEMLSAADKARGFPAGTMASVLQQEVGGQMDKFLVDPSAYHYEKNSDGKRVAAHTGKVSTAFGPFGILESTAADPGYGVAPLKDKSLAEQVRFAADYLGARSKNAGGLVAGLAGYGEGDKYASQVAGRLKGGAASGHAIRSGSESALDAVPVQVAQAPAAPIDIVPAEVPATPMIGAVPGNDPWQEFLAAVRKPVQASDLNYAPNQGQTPIQVAAAPVAPAFIAPTLQSRRPDFSSFAGWGARI